MPRDVRVDPHDDVDQADELAPNRMASRGPQLQLAARSAALVKIPHRHIPTSVAYSPDGRSFATSGNGVRLFDARDGRPTRDLEVEGDVRSVAFSPDGLYLATGSTDRATIWDSASGEVRFILGGHAGLVTSVAFSPAAALLATACGDGVVRIWQL
jgi:WD40 repeat protein